MKRKFPQVILNFYNISVVYHLPRKSENFAWNINGRLILSTRKAIFPENGISSKVDQNSQTEFPNGKCAFHLLVSLVPLLLAWIVFDPIFREKVVEIERVHSMH